MKLQFDALEISGDNYLSWLLDAELHLSSMGLGDTIKEQNQKSEQDKAKAMIFLRHHIHDGLKTEYLTVKDPLELWTNLKERYDHQKDVTLPAATYEWLNLRLQDFKCVNEYNSALYNITSRLLLCGQKVSENDMLEKTYQTMPPANMILMQTYRNRGFTKYSQLLTALLVAEKNSELLLKNHEIRPTGSAPHPEINNVSSNTPRDMNQASHNSYGYNKSRGNRRGGQNNWRGGRGRGRNGRGRGRGYFGQTRGHEMKRYSGNNQNHYRGQNNSGKDYKYEPGSSTCYRCGDRGHFAKVCHSSQQRVDRYKASLKGKNIVETNVVETDDEYDDRTEFLIAERAQELEQALND